MSWTRSSVEALDSSSTSLHMEGGNPELRYCSDGIAMFHGDEKMYVLGKVSDMFIDDRAYSASGHIHLSSAVIETYKAFSKALHLRMFRLKGEFDCPNEYIKRGLSTNQFRNLPVVRADILFPYYFKHSQVDDVKGYVLFDQVLPPNSAPDEHTRRVICVNVKRHGSLEGHIQDRTVVYLGGGHGDEVLSSPKNADCKYVEYRSPTTVAGPGAVEEENLYISSPFPETWRGTDDGLNIGIAKLRTGHFLYWATDCSPAPGQQLSPLPFAHVPKIPFWGHGGTRLQYWPIIVNGEAVDRFEIFQGAWVMRGVHLTQNVQEDDFPSGVIDRLRGGFFRGCGEEVVCSKIRVLSRMLKAKGSVERYGGKMFGFDENVGGIIQCDIESLAAHVRLPVDALLSFISNNGPALKLFRGVVSFLGTKDMEGTFEIVNPVPVGRWMRGRLLDTGTGLLYNPYSCKYFNVKLKDGVSWLSHYTGPGITVRKELNLGPLISIDH